MGMQDVLTIMVPGQAYSLEEICEGLEANGYRVTKVDTVMDSLYKLQQKGYVYSSAGLYIRTDELELFSVKGVSIVQEILSIMAPGQSYDARSIKGLRSTEGYAEVPRKVIKLYLELMAHEGLIETDDDEYYKLVVNEGQTD